MWVFLPCQSTDEETEAQQGCHLQLQAHKGEGKTDLRAGPREDLVMHERLPVGPQVSGVEGALISFRKEGIAQHAPGWT